LSTRLRTDSFKLRAPAGGLSPQGLIVGSPALAVLVSVSVIAVSRRWAPTLGPEASAFAFFADGMLAAIGSAAGGFLLPGDPTAARVGLAGVFAPVGFFAHWIIGAVILVFVYRF